MSQRNFETVALALMPESPEQRGRRQVAEALAAGAAVMAEHRRIARGGSDFEIFLLKTLRPVRLHSKRRRRK